MAKRPPLPLALAAAVLTAACAISADEPVPSLGRPCAVAEGSCDREHVCRPAAPGDTNGICVPVDSYGLCDAALRVTNGPGRLGEERAAEVTRIETAGNLNLIDEVRAVSGDVQVFRPGPEDAGLGDLCLFRDLQTVAGALAIGDSDIATLDGLQSLTHVGAGLVLFDNRALTSIDALLHLVSVGPGLLGDGNMGDGRALQVVIVGNTALPDAAVDGFLEALAARMGAPVAAVACGNRGRTCSGDDDALLRSLVANGVISP